MTEAMLNERTQILCDTLLSLRVDVDQLRKAYDIVNQLMDENAPLSANEVYKVAVAGSASNSHLKANDSFLRSA